MNLNSFVKKIACLLLAIFMLFSVVGCKEEATTAKKKKKVKKIIVVENVDDGNDDNDDTSDEEDWDDEDWDDEDWDDEDWDDEDWDDEDWDDEDWDDEDWDDEDWEDIPSFKTRPERDLPEVVEKLEILDDPIVHEFDYEYKDFTIDNSAVIIYGATSWENRYEGYTNYGTAAQAYTEVSATEENILAANDLRVWFSDNYNVNLVVYLDSVYAEKVAAGALTGNEKKILVGDSKYYTSDLSETDFAVTLKNGNLVFEGGHYAMVESAVDWFRSVKVEKGKVAVLTGKHENFKSQIVLDGVTYDYIWGDEFDGYELKDDDKWPQGTFGLERQDDMANIWDDPHFQYVENGKIRLTGDRYYDEGNGKIGYATNGSVETQSTAVFRNGYFEFYARLPYRRGGFPAIWTMTADAGGLSGSNTVPNLKVNDGFGVYKDRVWDLEFDLFESFADADHMTTTIHKWYTPKYTSETDYNNRTSFGPGNDKKWYDLTVEEEKIVEADLANLKQPASERYNWTVENPTKRGNASWKKCDVHKTTESEANKCCVYYYVDNGEKKYICEGQASQQKNDIASGEYVLNTPGFEIYYVDENGKQQVLNKDADGNEKTYEQMINDGDLKPAHTRQKILFTFNDGTVVDTFEYRLSPYTNMSNGMATYAYSFSYTGTPSERRKDEDGVYGDWRWYFDEDTINNEYHLYAFKYTSNHCTVYMDGEVYLDFDWDPAYDYKDLDGDGKGDDISRDNNGVGYNFWQYFLVDMMIYTPGNYNIDYARKIQVGDCPFNLYIDYVRFYQDLDDPSQATHFLNGVSKY